MNIAHYIFYTSILTVSCNAFGMFGFGRELRHYPHELKAMSQEEAIIRQNKETREQTAARHEAEARRANPELWERRDQERSAYYKAKELQQEQENMKKLEAALAEQAHIKRPVNKQTAQDFAQSNQKFEQARTRRSSTEQQCPNDRFIKLNVSCPVKK
jgi:flagellar biosynthesis GTPase FlhF